MIITTRDNDNEYSPGPINIRKVLSSLQARTNGEIYTFQKTDPVWGIGRLSKPGGLEILGIFPRIIDAKKFRKRGYSAPGQHKVFLMSLLDKIYGPKTKVSLSMVLRQDGGFPEKDIPKSMQRSTRYDDVTQEKHRPESVWGFRVWPLKFYHLQEHKIFIHGTSSLHSSTVDHLVTRLGVDPNYLPDIMYIKPKKASLSKLLKDNHTFLRWWTDRDNGAMPYLMPSSKTEKFPKDADILSLLEECQAIVATLNRGFYLFMKDDASVHQMIMEILDRMASDAEPVIPVDKKLTRGWNDFIQTFSD